HRGQSRETISNHEFLFRRALKTAARRTDRRYANRALCALRRGRLRFADRERKRGQSLARARFSSRQRNRVACRRRREPRAHHSPIIDRKRGPGWTRWPWRIADREM